MSDPIANFLERVGAHRRRHSGRSLYEHLRGTERLLRSWDCAEETCLAGLFHSIYGTNAFRQSTLDVAERASLVGLIGARAERLVYLFHIANRPRAWFSALQSGGCVNRLNGQFVVPGASDLANLIEIECANLIEQGSGQRFVTLLADALEFEPIELGSSVTRAIAQFAFQPLDSPECSTPVKVKQLFGQ